MFRTVFFLALFLFGVLVALTFAIPATIPGQGNPLAALAAIGLLLAGAWLEAGKCRWRPIFFIYGCLGGLPFIMLLYPDRRALLGQAISPNPAQKTEDWIFTIACIIGVLFAGVVCRFVAYARHSQVDGRLRRIGRCRRCGYLLHGLPELRCPECGTPFDADESRATAEKVALEEGTQKPTDSTGGQRGC